MTIKERILKIAEEKGLAKQSFCESIGLTYGGFTGENKKRPVNSDAIANLLALHSDINPTWLLTGQGSMLCAHGEPCTTTPTHEHSTSTDRTALEMIRELSAENALLKDKIERMEKEKQESAYTATSAPTAHAV